jgi:hypothetical protein
MLGDVMQYKQMERQDERNTMAGIAQMQQMANQEKHIALQEAQVMRQMKADAELEAKNNRMVDMTIHPAFLSLPDEQKQAALKYFAENGYTDKAGKGRAIDIQTGVATIEGSKNLFSQFMWPTVQAKKQAAVDAWGAVQKAQESGDKDKIAKAMATFNTAKMSYEASDEKYSGHLMKLDEQSQKDEIAERRLAETERANRAREDARDRQIGVMAKNAETTARKAVSSGKELSFGDKEALRSMGKQLPKSKIAAQTAVKNIQNIDSMIKLIDQGAGGVRGEIISKINKVVDVMRTTPPEDAKYNTLKAKLRGFAGTLRLQLGLIGQTSDRDVAIMYEAAGGMSPAESQKAILQGYRQAYEQDVTNYNSDAQAYSEYSKASGSLYKPISIQGGSSTGGATVVERRKTKDGRILEKLSDGSIREAK